jgi:2-O-methyltransferase
MTQGQDCGVPVRGADLMAGEVRRLLGRDDPLIIEVGCNDGETTQQFLGVMPRATILCFEPDPRPLARFRCRGDRRVILCEHAISHRCETLTFYQSSGEIPGSAAPCAGDWDYSGSLCRPTGHLTRDPRITFDRTIEVYALPLDSAIPSLPMIDLLWVDVQGAEARLILGAQQTLARTRYLYTEFYDTPMYDRQPDLKALVAFLPDFDLIGIYGENALFRNRNLFQPMEPACLR